MQRFHHNCVRTMLRITRHTQWKRRLTMKKLFADLGNRVRPLRWHYETRLLRWAGHIARMKHDRLPLMLMTSWCPNSRPVGCPRMTFGRTLKKALKRRPEIWPELKFNRPDDWETLTDAAQLRLHNAHAKAKRKHDIEMQTHWMTLAQQDRNQWRALVRGPEPESTRKAASRRARSARNGRRHGHQPLHFQPVNFVPAARQPVQFVPAGQPQNPYQQHHTFAFAVNFPNYSYLSPDSKAAKRWEIMNQGEMGSKNPTNFGLSPVW